MGREGSKILLCEEESHLFFGHSGQKRKKKKDPFHECSNSGKKSTKEKGGEEASSNREKGARGEIPLGKKRKKSPIVLVFTLQRGVAGAFFHRGRDALLSEAGRGKKASFFPPRSWTGETTRV